MRMLKQMQKNSLQEGFAELGRLDCRWCWVSHTTAVVLHRQLQVSSCQTDTASVSSLADSLSCCSSPATVLTVVCWTVSLVQWKEPLLLLRVLVDRV